MSSEPVPTIQEQAAAMNAARAEAERKRAEDHPLIIAERLLEDRKKLISKIDQYRGYIASAESTISDFMDQIERKEHEIGLIASEYRRRTKAAKLRLHNGFIEINKKRESTAVKVAVVRAWMEAQLQPEELEQFRQRREVVELHLPSFKERLHFNEHGEAFYGEKIVPGIKKIVPAPDDYVVKIHDRDMDGDDNGDE